MSVENLTEAELTRVLAYAGLVLVAFELVKSLIVKPIKAFYWNVAFGERMPFKSYEQDVLSRHRNEFEACLLYLRDFMEAIDAEDMNAIQELREHRNEVAHNLANRLHVLDLQSYAPLLERANNVLFRLSNYRTYMEIGSDPAFQNKGIDWNTVKGHEYALFEEVLDKVRILQNETPVNETTADSSREMKIACLGWGSLVWQPKSLPVVGLWHSDGPNLPVEFARQSGDNRVTLVILPDGPVAPVLWAMLGVQSVEEAKNALAIREGIPQKNIDRDIGFWCESGSSGHTEAASIKAWALFKGIDAVVWTALPPGFKKSRGISPSVDEVILHLNGLEGTAKRLAEEYVRRAPVQVQTPYRSAIERALTWKAEPAGKMITRSMEICAEAWSYDEIRRADGARVDQLESSGSPDELCGSLALALQDAIDRNDIRLAIDSKKNQFKELRTIVQFRVSPQLYDWLFNGRTGYRAQFWCDPVAGIELNGRIIEALTRVLAAQLPGSIKVRAIELLPGSVSREERDAGEKIISRERLIKSLNRDASKLWICERLYSAGGGPVIDIGSLELIAARRSAKLCVPRWARAINPDTSEGGEGLRAPFPQLENSWLDLKGGFLDSDGNLTQPKPQDVRAQQIHEYGWTWAPGSKAANPSARP